MAGPLQHPAVIQALQQDLIRKRRVLSAESIRVFAKLYFNEHLSMPLSPMHEELYAMLDEHVDRADSRLAIAAPRGSAKSTLVTLIYLLWVICYRKKLFIVLASDTADKAAEFLNHVKMEILVNPRLQMDFPEVCEPGGRVPRPPRWREHEIVTHNKVRVLALGYGQNVRGRRSGHVRPDLILLDDVECRENTHTADQREKLRDWFNRSILKAGSKRTQVIVIGTIQHYDSLLATLTDAQKSPTWTSRIYRSVIARSNAGDHWEYWANVLHGRTEFEGQTGPDAARRFFESRRESMLEGTEVLWPESKDYYDLMLMLETEGRASFDAEMQNEPIDSESCLFAEEDFVYWDHQYSSEQELLNAIGRDLVIVGACDPSLGRQNRHSDDSAIITLAMNKRDGNLYVIDADISRRKPDDIIRTVMEYARIREYRLFGFEANQFQSVLADELRKQSNISGPRLSVHDIVNTGDKTGRIQRLQPLVHSGTIQFCRRHQVLLDQLRHFPKAAHDDGPDALEMAVTVADKHRRRSDKPVLATTSHRIMKRVTMKTGAIY